jgi:hypothetical protein
MSSTVSTPLSTPSTAISVYFDAPIVHMHSSSPTTEDVPAEPLSKSAVTDAPIPASQEPALAPVFVEETPTPKSGPPSVAPADTPVSTSPVPQTEAELAESQDVVDPNGVHSTLSPNGHGRAGSLGYSASVSKRSVFTNADGQSIAGSTFINGAGTTGPNATAEHDSSLHQRAATADSILSEEQKAKIAKNEGQAEASYSSDVIADDSVQRKAINNSPKSSKRKQRSRRKLSPWPSKSSLNCKRSKRRQSTYVPLQMPASVLFTEYPCVPARGESTGSLHQNAINVPKARGRFPRRPFEVRVVPSIADLKHGDP